MARPSGPKTRNGRTWTEARFNSFIKGNLRRTSTRWGPIGAALKRARVARGEYKCSECRQTVPASTKVDGRRIKNVHVDHILPIIDPEVGFVSWDEVIKRMFVEVDGLQVMCNECHKIKTDKEKDIARTRRLKEGSSVDLEDED